MSFNTTNWDVRDGKWVSWEGPMFALNQPDVPPQSSEDLLLEFLALRLHTLDTLSVAREAQGHDPAERDRFIRTEGEIEGILTAVRTLRGDIAADFEATARRLADEWPH